MGAPKEEYSSLFWEGEGYGRRLRFADSAYRWDFEFPYDADLIAKLRGIPGVTARREGKRWVWRVPLEVARHFGLLGPGSGTIEDIRSLPAHLHSYQVDAIHAADRQSPELAFLVEHAMGTGKTVTAIAWMAKFLAQGVPGLVITPGGVVPKWHRELRAWGSESDLITVTSWHQLHKICDQKFGWVVPDEIHNAKTPHVRMSMSLGRLRLGNPGIPMLGLTGTLVVKESIDLWHQLHCLWPGRFGTYWEFARRYCQLEQSEYGVGVFGQNPENAEELRWRLAALAHTVTRDQVKHLLPQLNVMRHDVKKPRVKDLKELFSRSIEPKYDAALELFEAARDEGQKKFVVMCHYKRTVMDCAQKLEAAGFKVTRSHGGIHTPFERDAAIEAWKAQPEGVLVITMDSVKEGVRFNGCQTAAYLELCWSPGQAAQSLGRFEDITMAGEQINVYLVVVENSQEEQQAAVLERRYREIANLRPTDEQRAATADALHLTKSTDQLLAELSALDIPDLDMLEDI